MGVLDYDAAGMEALASTLISCAMGIGAQGGALPTTCAVDFQGPAATQYFADAKAQRDRIDADYGDLMAAAARLRKDAADVRVRQAEERRLIAEARAATVARSRAEAAERARRSGGAT